MSTVCKNKKQTKKLIRSYFFPLGMFPGKPADLPIVHINMDLSSGVTFDFDTTSNVEIGPDVFTVSGLNCMT